MLLLLLLLVIVGYMINAWMQSPLVSHALCIANGLKTAVATMWVDVCTCMWAHACCVAAQWDWCCIVALLFFLLFVACCERNQGCDEQNVVWIYCAVACPLLTGWKSKLPGKWVSTGPTPIRWMHVNHVFDDWLLIMEKLLREVVMYKINLTDLSQTDSRLILAGVLCDPDLWMLADERLPQFVVGKYIYTQEWQRPLSVGYTYAARLFCRVLMWHTDVVCQVDGNFSLVQAGHYWLRDLDVVHTG